MSTTKTFGTSAEIDRIVTFVRDFAGDHERVVIPVSGGLDSDVVARLCCESLGRRRVKLFTVIQSDMEDKFLINARSLAQSLQVSLAEIHLEAANIELMSALEQGEPEALFSTKKLLDPAKAKCSVRSAIISCYQDKGFLIAGTTNRSERELGFFLTFGDNLAHFKPIAHLYKSQLGAIAQALGTAENVIAQEPSSGFWPGQTDLEDLAYWIINDGPIVFPREFTEAEQAKSRQIQEQLSQEKIDLTLQMYAKKRPMAEIIRKTGLAEEIVLGITRIVEKAKTLKNREIMAKLPD